MKVIGTAEGGFLVSATERELANICGYAYEGSAPWKNSSANRHGDGRLQPGTVIPVEALFNRLGALRDGERKLKEGAAHLRALATLMETQTPDALIPEPEFAEVEGG